MTCHFPVWRHRQNGSPYCRSRYFKRQHKTHGYSLQRDQYTQQQDRSTAQGTTATINGFSFG